MCALNAHISQLAMVLQFLASRQAYTCCLVFMQSVSACREATQCLSHVFWIRSG